MKDQEIYSAIAQILYNESPTIEDDTSLLFRVGKGFNDITLWSGKYLTKDGNFGLSRDGLREVEKLIHDLKGYFQSNGHGEWNVIHFILKAGGNSFDAKFDNNLSLDNGSLPFWKYSFQFREQGYE